MLTAERTALNLLTHLSGIATATRAWVDAVAGTGARIRDTRKTLPGLRALEKYAVRCGGGVNHRMSLGDAALIKDNHVAAAGSVRAAIEAVRALRPDIPLEVEVDTLDQFDEAVDAGAELVLLDNFSTARHGGGGRRAASAPRRVLLEASGGLTLDRAAEVAATGVDFLAVGALTHSAPALDLGLDLVALSPYARPHAADGSTCAPGSAPCAACCRGRPWTSARPPPAVAPHHRGRPAARRARRCWTPPSGSTACGRPRCGCRPRCIDGRRWTWCSGRCGPR